MLAIVVSATLNCAYLIVGVVALWALVIIANRTGITGAFFTLHGWLDDIHGRDATGVARPDPHALPKAVFLAGFLIAGAVLVAPFIR